MNEENLNKPEESEDSGGSPESSSSSSPTPSPEPVAPAPTPPPAQPSSESTEMAGAGERFIAFLIDYAIIFVVVIIPVIGWTIGALVAMVYSLTKDALPFLNGQSIGKKAMKLRVVKEDTKAPITNDYGSAIVRQVSLMIPIFGIVDAFMVLSESKKRFGDQWAKTIVIKEKA